MKRFAKSAKSASAVRASKFCPQGGTVIVLETQPDQSAPIDVGFRCLRLDSSNMENVYYTPDEVSQQDMFSLVDNVKPDRTPGRFVVPGDAGSGCCCPAPLR